MNAAHDPYTFTFRAEAGGAGDLAQYVTVLRIDSAAGRALLLLNRHNGDAIRRPVGLFGGTLSPEEAALFAAAIDGTRWAELPRPAGGDVNAATLSLDYARAGRIVQRRFNARNVALVQALAPLMTAIDELSNALLREPKRAIDVSLQWTARGCFTLTLRNVGTGPVILADPRALGRASVVVAPDAKRTPGKFAPLPTFLPVPLEVPAAPGPPLSLGPGQSHDIDSVAWSAPASASYVAQGIWKDYTGPAADPAALLPALPDGDAADRDPRPYPLRGAAFSGYLHFTAEKRR